MSATAELNNTQERIRQYVQRLRRLLELYRVDSLASLVAVVRHEKDFRSEWLKVWREIARDEGGKISLTTFGLVLGSSLGGVGVAAMGTAFGLPLAAILGVAGFIAGAELDAARRFFNQRRVMLGISKELYERIHATAALADMDPKNLMVSTLEHAFPPQLPVKHR